MERENRLKKINSLLGIVLVIIGVVYVAVLLKIVIFKYGLTNDLRSISLIPFSFLSMFNGEVSLYVALKNVLGNIFLFVPLGIYLNYFLQKNVGKSILIGFLVSLSFETIQYTVGCGAADIDDLLLNTIGVVMGVLLYKCFISMVDKRCGIQIGMVAFLSLFGICGVLSLYIFAPGVLPTQIERINEEIYVESGLEDFTVSLVATGIDEGELIGDVEKKAYNKSGEIVDFSQNGRYVFASDAIIILENRAYEYSASGDIQKMTITYEEATMEELAQVLEKNRFVYLLLNEKNEIVAISVNIM